MKHELKTWPEFYERVKSGHKTVEIRKNDRDFALGDTLVLNEWHPLLESYTGRSMERVVTDILSDDRFMQPGFVALSIRDPHVLSINQMESMLSEMDGLYRSVSVNPSITAHGTEWSCEVLDCDKSIAFAEMMPSMSGAVRETYRQYKEWCKKQDEISKSLMDAKVIEI